MNKKEAVHTSRMLLHAISETNDPAHLYDLLEAYKDRKGVHPSVLKFGYAKLELMSCRDLLYTQKEGVWLRVLSLGKLAVWISCAITLAWIVAQIF